ncbi:unnamed protein product [Staurois parvus]|uniref:Uncharacterized protein n=1 Tax=Staurois parvus TaxID=386267 RepID=A0ABN9AP08_9NEOB|nr:unnamed protein product [Staurois parvus]
MISVAPEVPPVSAHQYHISVHTSAHQCHISVPTLAAFQCHPSVPSVPPTSASQCRLTVPCISIMYQCCLSVPISDACQCPSVQSTSASSSVQPISAHRCSLISAHQ